MHSFTHIHTGMGNERRRQQLGGEATEEVCKGSGWTNGWVGGWVVGRVAMKINVLNRSTLHKGW